MNIFVNIYRYVYLFNYTHYIVASNSLQFSFLRAFFNYLFSFLLNKTSAGKMISISHICWLTLCHQSVAFLFLLDKEMCHVRHCVHLHFRFHFSRGHFLNQLTLNMYVENSSNLSKPRWSKGDFREKLTKFNKR